MPVTLSFVDICLRIGLALIGAAIVGFNRGERNEAAGMRTTILVCMAACFATLLANDLLSTTGKDQHSFAQIDVLRLPLGILSGIGFIGAGAIIKKGDMALGVTTAATMWFMTVVGICFGAGKLGLGCVATAIALFVLWILKWFDKRMPRNLRANLTVVGTGRPVDEARVRSALVKRRYRIVSISTTQEADSNILELVVQWRGQEGDLSFSPPVLADIQADGFEQLRWQPSELV